MAGAQSPKGKFVGPVKVTLAAAENPGGTGVAKIEYSLDQGQTVRRYSGPFTVESAEPVFILAKATDRAATVAAM